MDKSPDAFRTISEVAEHLDTPAHVLRFWESRFPQIRPVKRAGGRRYYRPSDVSLLTGIKRLLHDEGMTIRGVQKILREQGVRHVAGLSGDDGFVDDFGSGDHVAEMPVAKLPVVERPSAEPIPFRPTPGLAAAMAKVIDHGQSNVVPAPSSPIEQPEPAQGALLLTPAPEPVVEPAREPDSAAIVQASLTAQAAPEQDNIDVKATSFDAGADEDDDFEDAVSVPLATRVRALPQGASAANVATELLAVMARLHALRDSMSDASRPGGA